MERNKILNSNHEAEEENPANPEEDLSLFQELPALFQKDPEKPTFERKEKGNLPALILGSTGFLCLVIGLMIGLIFFFR